MFDFFSRLSWLIALIAGLSIFAIDEELFLFAIGAVFIVRFFILSDNFIKEALSEKSHYKENKFSLNQETVKKETPMIPSHKPKIAEETPMKVEKVQVIAKDSPPQKVSKKELSVIEKFFSENLLAKLGGILVFLGVLFLLSLVYSVIGPVAKMCIGFIIGFSCFGAGVWLDKKGYIAESRIVLGVAILINYLVILSGRYILEPSGHNIDLIGNPIQNNILTVGVTFFFLILNTLFAIVTALLYNSRPLLIFGFAFAYLNPLLLGESSTEPYTLLGYTMIVTLGALYMSYSRKDSLLFPLTFILASLMFLIAPWSDGTGWISKLLSINFLGALSLYVSTLFKKSLQNISEILIGGTFFLIGCMGFLGIENLSNLQMLIMGVSSLALMLFCYISSEKGAYLYSIGTLGTILTLSPAIYTNGLQESMLGVSSFIVIGFGLLNLGVILMKNKEFLSDNIGNVISGLISGAIFLTYMIYFFGNEYFPGVLQGFVFFGLAVIYCLLAFLIVSKIGIEDMRGNQKYENTFYTISAIGVSLFSLAIAFVFAGDKEIVSIIWLLEANVLFFLSRRLVSYKVAFAALILFVIGIMKFVDFIDLSLFWGKSFSGDYGTLVALSIILTSLISNLFILSGKNKSFLSPEFHGVHNLFHVVGVFLITVTGHEILNIRGEWHSLLYFSISLTALGVLYEKISSKGLKSIHLIVYIALMLIHILMFADSIGRERLDISISTFIAGIYSLPFIYDIIVGKGTGNKKLLHVFFGYIFILSTLYVYHIFEVTFAVTLYWGVLSFILLSYGISKNILPMRTLGLYLITLTAGKIFLYDIWMSVDDTVSRVVALIVVGILMIVLSTMYTRKYGNNLNSEFNLSNLFTPKKPKIKKKSIDSYSVKQERVIQKSKIQKDIEAIDISGITQVKLQFKSEEKSTFIRSENLIKIARLIANTYKKTDFAPGELSQAFDTIEKNYKSSLSPAQYKKTKDIVGKFVEQGGSIEFLN